jgi:hypothetical protein
MYQHQPQRVSVVADTYDDLYRARNLFMHGNPVAPRDLRYRHTRTRLHLELLAPEVFK